jgi:hypothetical protein
MQKPMQKSWVMNAAGGRMPNNSASHMRTALGGQDGIFQELWRKVKAKADAAANDNDYIDDSSDGTVILGGRYMLPESKHAIYWGIHDNRVYFSHPFHKLSTYERLQVVNQVLVAEARLSRKDDLRTAALAVSDGGNFFVTHNTQERNSMAKAKQCAEDNMDRIMQMLGKGERVNHIYVLGGLTDEKTQTHINAQLIGMCMRCVEVAPSYMQGRHQTPSAQFTSIPGNDGKVAIPLSGAEDMKDVLPGHAWQVPYWNLKTPSLLFPAHIKDREAETFNRLCNKQIVGDFSGASAPQAFEVANPPKSANGWYPDGSAPSIAHIRKFMLAKLALKMNDLKQRPREAAIALVEIYDPETKSVRYTAGHYLEGPEHNAFDPPITHALERSGLARPERPNSKHPEDPKSPYVRQVYCMGYRDGGAPYEINDEQWDRLYKRVGDYNVADCNVRFMPMIDGEYDQTNDVPYNLAELTRTRFAGSAHLRAEHNHADHNHDAPRHGGR